MKIIVVGLMSFIFGIVLAGIVAIKFFVYGGQSVAVAEMIFYSKTLESIETNDIDSLKQTACQVLPIAIEQKSEWDNSFFANDFFHGVEDWGAEIEQLSLKHLSPNGICSNT